MTPPYSWSDSSRSLSSNMPCFHRTNCSEQNNCDWVFWKLRLPCCTSEESLRCFKDIDCIACAPVPRRRRRKKMQRNSCSSFQETTVVRHHIPSLSCRFCCISSFPHFASASTKRRELASKSGGAWILWTWACQRSPFSATATVPMQSPDIHARFPMLRKQTGFSNSDAPISSKNCHVKIQTFIQDISRNVKIKTFHPRYFNIRSFIQDISSDKVTTSRYFHPKMKSQKVTTPRHFHPKM